MAEYDQDNVRFYYSDGANTYTLEYNPKTINHWYEEVKEEVPLDGGLTKFYHRGYKLHALLSWDQPIFFKKDQYDALRAIFNTHDEIIYNPAPVSASGATFLARWRNNFDFVFVAGVTPFGYVGSIELEGTEILTSIPSTFSLGDM